MPDNAVVLLDTLLDEREKTRGGPPLPADEAFELFCFEQCLKEQDLSPDEITNGRIGGGDDGGIDGAYTFLNGLLVEDDAEVLDEEFDATKIKRGPILTLVIVQAKQTPSFAETPFEKLSATLQEVLALSNSEEPSGAFFGRPRRAARDLPPGLAQALHPPPDHQDRDLLHLEGQHRSDQ